MSDIERMNSLEAANGVLASHCIDLRAENARLTSDYIRLDALVLRGKFKVGHPVQKKKGYKFPGTVIGLAQKLDGRILYLVECTADGASGMCHIFGENDLEEMTDE